MMLVFQGYGAGRRIVSIAKTEETKMDLLESGLSFLCVRDKTIKLFPENIDLELNERGYLLINETNDYDVFQIWDSGKAVRCYDNSSIENYFFVTGRCNSNCIMCPSPDFSRKNGEDTNIDDLIEIARHIPSDAPHLTITGGEPFMVGERIFEFFSFLKNKFQFTDFLVLTNGRIFALDSYIEMLKTYLPENTLFGIPIHGSCPDIHDAITQTKNSFDQTFIGIKKLIKNHFRVELRIVVNKKNVEDFERLSEFIIRQLSSVEYISVMAMEMTGSAYVNRDSVWIPYKQSFQAIEKAIQILLENEIDVKLYNFPLCTVEKKYWTICEKSISKSKIRFSDICESCLYKKSCGGVFAGTYQLEKEELKAII